MMRDDVKLRAEDFADPFAANAGRSKRPVNVARRAAVWSVAGLVFAMLMVLWLLGNTPSAEQNHARSMAVAAAKAAMERMVGAQRVSASLDRAFDDGEYRVRGEVERINALGGPVRESFVFLVVGSVNGMGIKEARQVSWDARCDGSRACAACSTCEDCQYCRGGKKCGVCEP